MMQEFKPAEYTFKDDRFKSNENSESPRKGLNMLIKKADSKIKVSIADNIPEIHISVKFSGYLSEYMWDDLDKDAEQSNIEDAMTSEITRECNDLVKYLQSIGSDPIGLGDIVEVHDYNYWKSIDWTEVYKESKIDVQADVTYEQNGAIR